MPPATKDPLAEGPHAWVSLIKDVHSRYDSSAEYAPCPARPFTPELATERYDREM